MRGKLGSTLAGAIERALGQVPYDPPVTTAYAAAVRDVIREHVPAESTVDVYSTVDNLVITVVCDDVTRMEVLPLF